MGSNNLDRQTGIKLYFDGPADAGTVNSSNIWLQAGNDRLESRVEYDPVTHTASIVGPVVPSTSYSVQTGAGLRSETQGTLVAQESTAFTTRPLRNVNVMLDEFTSNVNPSIAVGPNHAVHILFDQLVNSGTTYSTCPADCSVASNWTSVAMDTTVFSEPRDITVDRDGVVHVLYGHWDSRWLRYAQCAVNCTDAGNWTTIVLDSNAVSSYAARIAVDENRRVHVVYDLPNVEGVRYATCESQCTVAARWNKVLINSGAGYIWWLNLAVVNGRVHVAARNNYYSCAANCTTQASWTISSLSGLYGYVGFLSMAVGKDNVVHVTYREFPGNRQRYGWCKSNCGVTANWSSTEMDIQPGQTNSYSSITVDAGNRLGITYYISSPEGLRYATCAVQCGWFNSWRSIYIDTGHVGAWGASALDDDSGLHVAYLGEGLKYAE